MKKTILTGIKPTGKIHLGNYIGAIKPALESAKVEDYQAAYFIADYHGLTKIHNADEFRQLSYGIAATWLALGLDPEKVIFYRQSDVPEIFELSWILTCFSPKGLMNRAHAYKAIVENNKQADKDADFGVNMGIFTYPILMAADILLFRTNIVPVGKDQVQHVEIARDIAESFNNIYGETFLLPEYQIQEDTAVLPGLDGRKMSKSYNNTIPLFEDEKKLKKLINKIKTDSLPPEATKDPDSSILFSLYQEFAAPREIEELRIQYEKGIGWGEVKQELFRVMNRFLEQPREKYNELMASPEVLDEILAKGAEKARSVAVPFLKEIKKMVGLY
ncbi:tryptophan--tRNA ligase [Lederbergia wuyishanensis]|uniref:Tryptophan--tRNA ligase n=1 Tax=Lederbergia wuyishanensis TaxID=1347903 RepID=A0ABU0D6D7_9BACI|nr:tryptophan--tRNA ligase [Lederbergia wuyishanensis]MCJ8008611.1 tryptophan--tRNA ligase [Lederbergia wuyishanensis]MDQ0343973.1 tryptophanyl-tRNA synthetase [Lederbergia wuyishanensis]